jgi:hypothetical protein
MQVLRVKGDEKHLLSSTEPYQHVFSLCEEHFYCTVKIMDITERPVIIILYVTSD